MNNTTYKVNPWVIIAAVSLIIFSIVGIAAITGQMTAVNSETKGLAASPEEKSIKPNITPIFVEKRASAPKVERSKPCANCAVVDSIIVSENKEDGGGVSMVPGSVADGQTATMSAYLVKVRMDDGTYRVVSQQDQPVFHAGEKVKIVNNKIVHLEETAKMDKNHIFALMLAALTSRLF